MKLTISGDLGSGKSTVGKILSDKLKLKYYSTGSIFRKLAADMQVSLQELGELAKKDKRIDKKIDDYQKKLGEKEDNFILEGRLGFFFIPDSIKICLTVDINEAAKRILNDNRRDEKFQTADEAVASIKLRRQMEKERYLNLYNIDIENKENYNIVIDTTIIPANEVADKIIKSIKEKY